MFGIDFNFKELTAYAVIFFIGITIFKIFATEVLKFGFKGILYAFKKILKLVVWLLLLPFWIIRKINNSYLKSVGTAEKNKEWWYDNK